MIAQEYIESVYGTAKFAEVIDKADLQSLFTLMNEYGHTQFCDKVDYVLKLEELERVLTEERDCLKSMIDWMVEAHGESSTTKYTGDSSPWLLKNFVSEHLQNEYAEIRENARL